jgi:hypothetical protein
VSDTRPAPRDGPRGSERGPARARLRQAGERRLRLGLDSEPRARLSDRLERLPGPRRDALAPDRFLVGLAALGLVSDVAGDLPPLRVIDDAQWLDRASAQALGLIGRRLVAESVALVFAARVGTEEQSLARLPELVVEGLPEGDGRALLQ